MFRKILIIYRRKIYSQDVQEELQLKEEEAL